MMAIGSACDYSISKTLYHQDSLLGAIFMAFGEYPMGLALAAAGAMLISVRNREKKKMGILQMVLGAFLILSSASMLVQIPVRQASALVQIPDNLSYIPFLVSALLCIAAIGLTIWGMFSLCGGADRSTVIRVAITFVLFVLAEMILVNIIKIPWGRARMRLVEADSRAYFMPWWQPGAGLKNTLVAAGVAAEEFKSFPSGHTANASALMMLCLLPTIAPKLEDKRTMLFLVGFAWTCLVALTRIIMGAHYLTDTMVGFAVGYILLIVLTEVLFRREKD